MVVVKSLVCAALTRAAIAIVSHDPYHHNLDRS